MERDVLDEELSRLPKKYFAPLVLCWLEGHRQAEAARQMGLPLEVFARRLERGRALLRQRLVHRGFPLSAVSGALLWKSHPATASLPLALIESTVKLAMQVR